MKETTLESSAPHGRYMDFIAPKKKPIPAGTPTAELKKRAAAKSAAKKSVKKSVAHPVKKSPKLPEKPKSPVVQEKPVKEPIEKKTTPAAPDGTNYTLGGKSPFLTSVSVEKRPLSSLKSEIPKKNVYEPTEKPEKKPEKSPTKIIKQRKKSSDGLSIVIIVLTIILGAAAGIAAYYFLPLR